MAERSFAKRGLWRDHVESIDFVVVIWSSLLLLGRHQTSFTPATSWYGKDYLGYLHNVIIMIITGFRVGV